MSTNNEAPAQVAPAAPAAPAPAEAPAVPAAPEAPAAPVDTCAICRGTDFTPNALADFQLAAAPTRVNGREVARTVTLTGRNKVECCGLICRAKFHARCIAGTAGLAHAEADLAEIDVPLGWQCFWCAALEMLPGKALIANVATAFVRGSGCVSVLRFPRPALNPNHSVMLMCSPGLGNTRRGCSNVWPALSASLITNGLAIAIPRVPVNVNTNQAPVLCIGHVPAVPPPQPQGVLVDQNVISLTVAPGPDNTTLSFLMALHVADINTPLGMVMDVVSRRALSPDQALFVRLVHHELSRRAGRFLGMAFASLQAGKRAWRRFDVTKTAPFRIVTAFAPPEGAYEPRALPWSAQADAHLGAAAIMTYGAAGVPHTETSAIVNVNHGPMEVSFRDPTTRTNIKLPVRGQACLHASLFDLKTFIDANRAHNARWRCPHCRDTVLPSSIFLDSYVYGIMLCMSRGQLEGTRADAECAALFGGAPGGIAGAAGPVGFGALKVPVNGVFVDNAIEGVSIRTDGSWTAIAEEVIEIADDDVIIVEAAPEPPAPVEAPPAVPADAPEAPAVPVAALAPAAPEAAVEAAPAPAPAEVLDVRVQPARAAKRRREE